MGSFVKGMLKVIGSAATTVGVMSVFSVIDESVRTVVRERVKRTSFCQSKN